MRRSARARCASCAIYPFEARRKATPTQDTVHLRGHYRLTPALDGPALKQRASVLPASRHGRGRRLSAKVHVAKVVSHAAGIVSTVDAVAEAELAVLVVAETLIR